MLAKSFFSSLKPKVRSKNQPLFLENRVIKKHQAQEAPQLICAVNSGEGRSNGSSLASVWLKQKNHHRATRKTENLGLGGVWEVRKIVGLTRKSQNSLELYESLPVQKYQASFWTLISHLFVVSLPLTRAERFIVDAFLQFPNQENQRKNTKKNQRKLKVRRFIEEEAEIDSCGGAWGWIYIETECLGFVVLDNYGAYALGFGVLNGPNFEIGPYSTTSLKSKWSFGPICFQKDELINGDSWVQILLGSNMSRTQNFLFDLFLWCIL